MLFTQKDQSLNIAAMCFLSTYEAGPYVLKKAQISDKSVMYNTWRHGKNSWTSVCRNMLCYMAIVYPTVMPIMTPKKQDDRTRMSAS